MPGPLKMHAPSAWASTKVGAAAGLPKPMMDTGVGLQPAGMVTPGNINLADRPTVHNLPSFEGNPNSSVSTVDSMSFNQDGHEILVPTVSDDGRILTEQQAIDQYRRTGRHLGIFVNPAAATTYAQALHNDYASGKYGDKPENVPIQTTPWNPTIPKK